MYSFFIKMILSSYDIKNVSDTLNFNWYDNLIKLKLQMVST